MKNSKKYLVLFALVLSVFTSCAKSSESIESLISVSYETVPGISALNAANIVFTNNSNYCIVFPLLDGLEIIVEHNGQFITIDNLVDIVGSQDFILSAKGDIFSTRSVYLRPDISNLTITDSAQFTAHFTGYLCDNKNIEINKDVIFTIPPPP